MSDVTKELGRLISAQQKRIHDLIDALEQPELEERYEALLDLLLDRHILIRDLLIDTAEEIVNLQYD